MFVFFSLLVFWYVAVRDETCDLQFSRVDTLPSYRGQCMFYGPRHIHCLHFTDLLLTFKQYANHSFCCIHTCMTQKMLTLFLVLTYVTDVTKKSRSYKFSFLFQTIMCNRLNKNISRSYLKQGEVAQSSLTRDPACQGQIWALVHV